MCRFCEFTLFYSTGKTIVLREIATTQENWVFLIKKKKKKNCNVEYAIRKCWCKCNSSSMIIYNHKTQSVANYFHPSPHLLTVSALSDVIISPQRNKGVLLLFSVVKCFNLFDECWVMYNEPYRTRQTDRHEVSNANAVDAPT